MLKVSRVGIEVWWAISTDHVFRQQSIWDFGDSHSTTCRSASFFSVAGQNSVSCYIHHDVTRLLAVGTHSPAHVPTHSGVQSILKIIIYESSGLITDFTHITQVKSDERLAEFVLIFLKKTRIINFNYLSSSLQTSRFHFS